MKGIFKIDYDTVAVEQQILIKLAFFVKFVIKKQTYPVTEKF